MKKQALPFKRRSSYQAPPEALHLETDPNQRHYDPRVHYPPVERDVTWMTDHGVQIPVVVEKDVERDLIVVVDGRQRVINLREANRRLAADGKDTHLIPVVVKKGSPTFLFEVEVVTNEHRQGDNPVVQAFKMKQYLSMERKDAKEGELNTVDDAAALWGVTDRTVRNRLYLLDLCEEVQQAVIEGSITVSRAISLRGLPKAEQKKALKKKPAPKAKAKRPSAKKVERVLGVNGKLPKTARVAIEWATGLISDDEAAEALPALGRILQKDTEDPNQTKLFS